MVDTTSARGIKASSSMTAAKGITSRTSPDVMERKLAAKKPAVTTPAKKPTTSKATPSKKPVAAKKTTYTPQDLTVGANEQLAINSLEGNAQTQAALRLYQEEAAKRNLQQSLKTIDRNALDLYKGISDDYAGRGMLRTGGYVQADDRAYQNVQDQKIAMGNSLTDLLRQNEIEAADQAGTLKNEKTDIMLKYLQAIMADKTKQMGAQ